MTTDDTVNISRLTVDHTDDSRIAWRPPPPPVRTSHTGTGYLIKSIAKQGPSSDGTSSEYEVTWQSWDEKDDTWEPKEIIAKAKEMVKQ